MFFCGNQGLDFFSVFFPRAPWNLILNLFWLVFFQFWTFKLWPKWGSKFSAHFFLSQLTRAKSGYHELQLDGGLGCSFCSGASPLNFGSTRFCWVQNFSNTLDPIIFWESQNLVGSSARKWDEVWGVSLKLGAFTRALEASEKIWEDFNMSFLRSESTTFWPPLKMVDSDLKKATMNFS